MPKNSSLIFIEKLPPLSSFGEDVVVIYDRVLVRKVPSFKSWLRQAPVAYAVQGGETLKSIETFARHVTRLTALTEGLSVRQLTFVVVGGGSVGDFGGFVASVFKRGVRLVHIPSTWLAALDSAHGGKTALNVGSTKNQIGTFYPAAKVYLVKAVLLAQPSARVFEAFAELLKIALIRGGRLWTSLAQEKKLDAALMWKYLPSAIRGKLRIVAQDPEEKSGLRHVLNLGHSMGHVLESYHQLPHGVAVNYGIHFALAWSLQLKIMSKAESDRIFRAPLMSYVLNPADDGLLGTNQKILSAFRKLLMKDKKKNQANRLRFIFLARPGKFLIRDMSVDDILIEICRQTEGELYD